MKSSETVLMEGPAVKRSIEAVEKGKRGPEGSEYVK